MASSWLPLPPTVFPERTVVRGESGEWEGLNCRSVHVDGSVFRRNDQRESEVYAGPPWHDAAHAEHLCGRVIQPTERLPQPDVLFLQQANLLCNEDSVVRLIVYWVRSGEPS